MTYNIYNNRRIFFYKY